jgi:hypothetical protein
MECERARTRFLGGGAFSRLDPCSSLHEGRRSVEAADCVLHVPRSRRFANGDEPRRSLPPSACRRLWGSPDCWPPTRPSSSASAGSIPSSTASSRRCGRSVSIGKNSKAPAPAAPLLSAQCRGYEDCRRRRRRSWGSPMKRRPESAESIRKKLATPRRCTMACPTCSGSPPRSRLGLAP